MLLGDNLLVAEAAAVGYAAYMGSLMLSQRLSRHSSRYRELPAVLRLEWDGRAPSTLHAVVITLATAYILLISPYFSDTQAGGSPPFVLRTTPASTAALGFSLGYFATDLLLLLLHYPAFGGPEMAAHHVAALASVAASAFQGQAHAYTLALLATECTTPFVNARFVLDKGGLKDHPAYTINGMLLLTSWVLGRIVLFFYFFRHVWAHLHQFHLLSPVSRGLIYMVPPLLFCLNLFWFTKILRGALRLLFGTPDTPVSPLVEGSGSEEEEEAGEEEAEELAVAAATAVAAAAAAADHKRWRQQRQGEQEVQQLKGQVTAEPAGAAAQGKKEL